MNPRILKNRKGIALESSILFMVIVFSFCFLLTSLALFGHYSVKLQKIRVESDTEIEQIGEDFVHARLNNTEFTSTEKYKIFATENTLTVTTKKGTPILYVELDETGKIIRWVLEPPVNEEN